MTINPKFLSGDLINLTYIYGGRFEKKDDHYLSFPFFLPSTKNKYYEENLNFSFL